MNLSAALYIIGNGFDLHHEIPSDYRDFGSYLAAVDCDTYREVEAYLDELPGTVFLKKGCSRCTRPSRRGEADASWSASSTRSCSSVRC
ncbi:MAG TPA: AbiH family protein [Rhodocyclaceae bacterium]|nr:AbiH family protein [Rhodocyclaceae bacterium]